MTTKTPASLLITAALVSAASGLRGDESPEAGLIRDVQSVNGDRIEPSLPAVPLRQWVEDLVGADAALTWEKGDCDLKPGPVEPADGHPVCVVVRGSKRTDRVGLRLHLLTSTTRGRRLPIPSVEPQSFVGCAAKKIRSVDSLLEFREALTGLRRTGGCT
jgi:hypothetical protein